MYSCLMVMAAFCTNMQHRVNCTFLFSIKGQTVQNTTVISHFTYTLFWYNTRESTSKSYMTELLTLTEHCRFFKCSLSLLVEFMESFLPADDQMWRQTGPGLKSTGLERKLGLKCSHYHASTSNERLQLTWKLKQPFLLVSNASNRKCA